MAGGRSPESFISRWSRRKLAAAREEATAGVASPLPVSDAPVSAPETAPPGVATAPAATPSEPLPPVDTLTFESDFTPFLKPGIEPDVQRAALRKLLRDPRFNAMDGLDVYIDDYSRPSPLDPAIARTLAHAQALFAPRPMQVNAEGVAVDMTDEELAAASRDTPALAQGGAQPHESPPAADAPPGTPRPGEPEGAQLPVPGPVPRGG